MRLTLFAILKLVCPGPKLTSVDQDQFEGSCYLIIIAQFNFQRADRKTKCPSEKFVSRLTSPSSSFLYFQTRRQNCVPLFFLKETACKTAAPTCQTSDSRLNFGQPTTRSTLPTLPDFLPPATTFFQKLSRSTQPVVTPLR
jgi:hypothetical protein